MTRVAYRRFANAACVCLFVAFIFPVYWMVATAFKPDADIQRYDPKWFPWPVYTGNFGKALTSPAFWTSLRSSLIVTCAVVGLGMLIAFLAAVALARFQFRGRTSVLVVIIVVQMIPIEALFIPFYLMLRQTGILGSLLGLVGVYLSFTVPFTAWMLRGFVAAVPPDLEEAAAVDGATRWQAFWRILFPLVAPGLVATSIFSLITAWTEFTYAYVLINDPANYTLPVYIQSFIGRNGTDFGPQMAVATLFTVPVVAFFLVIQKRAVAGLSAGAVKG